MSVSDRNFWTVPLDFCSIDIQSVPICQACRLWLVHLSCLLIYLSPFSYMHINGPVRLAILPAVKRDWITLEIICILISRSFLWNSSCFTYNKSMVICIYRQIQQFIVLNSAQQCYIFRYMRSSSGINARDYKNKLNVLKVCWNSRDLVNFPIFIILEYYIFYCVHIFVIKTMLYCFLLKMFVKMFLLKYIFALHFNIVFNDRIYWWRKLD